ncbi:hypothetical protein [uncultured Phenylobacterium sp.]|uniref:hypothetical protein n=1 Tax=uncultured Phenylobacterium sp. TaxID=349273 RepID=UPI0025E8D99F|nr:hypothetical protein [uncultured Phenylobacterium sp.]
MTTTWRPRIVLASLMAAGLSTAAQAQDATGDWIGTVKTPGAELTVTLHVKTGANGALEGHAGSPDQTPDPLPMTDVAVKDGTLSFAVPVVQATYAPKWDPAARAWTGTLTQAGYDMPLTLTRGKVGPRPTVAGLDGQWAGVLAAPQGDLRIVITVKTGAGGTSAMFASPDQSPDQMAAAPTRQGDAVVFELKGIGQFDGKLSPDGQTLEGLWRQGGGSLPLTLKKGG